MKGHLKFNEIKHLLSKKHKPLSGLVAERFVFRVFCENYP